jgi:hypothetical protein
MTAAHEKVRKVLNGAASGHDNGNGSSGERQPMDDLSDLLGLTAVETAITGARIVGTGLTASVELDLNGKRTIEFPSMKEFGQPDSLNLTLAAETGANAGLTKKTATQAMILLGKIAVRTEATTIREMAAGWGREFLQAVGEHPVDLSDQTSRYEALLELTGIDVVADTSRDGGSIAAASVVLVDATGVRLVRTNWFRAHVRSQEPSVSPQQIAQRMLLTGWERYGKTGKVHARRPAERTKGPEQLLVPFYVVPADWEARDVA